MACPQWENGFVKIANDILEALARSRIPGRELSVVFCVIRNSYGYNQKECALSYGDIAQQTDMSKKHAYRAVKSLSSKMVIGVSIFGDRVPKYGDTRKQVIKFNKNYDEWQLREKKTPIPKYGDKKVPKNGENDNSLPIIYKNKKTMRKKTAHKSSFPLDFEKFYQAYPLKKSKQAAAQKWKTLKKRGDLPPLETLISAINQQKTEKDYLRKNNRFCPDWKHPSTWLNKGCWDDEIIEENESKSEYPEVTEETVKRGHPNK